MCQQYREEGPNAGLHADEIIINTHHLSKEIDNFLEHQNYQISISAVKEEVLLDTGGGILNATKNFKDDPFFVLNPDTIWNKNYYEELKILENSYLKNNKPILLLVDKINSHDKSFKGDFNFKENNCISREVSNQYIFTGAQNCAMGTLERRDGRPVVCRPS